MKKYLEERYNITYLGFVFVILHILIASYFRKIPDWKDGITLFGSGILFGVILSFIAHIVAFGILGFSVVLNRKLEIKDFKNVAYFTFFGIMFFISIWTIFQPSI